MKSTVPSRGKHRGKHRSASTAPRTGAAALMIGGLVAGTVATAGAATLSQEPVVDDAGNMAAELSSPLLRAVDSVDGAASSADASRAAQLVNLRSGSLDELRDLSAADRSTARSAPADAESVRTLLDQASFTGTTVDVEDATGTETTDEPTEAATPEPAQEQEQEQEQQATTTRAAEAQTEPAAQPAQQAAPAAPAPVGGSVLNVAAAYVGYPYVLYGTPPYSFDCSAYTWWVFQQAGINIPRTVSGQKGAVTPVSDPQPGDLVFYNDYYHVGIYAGNGMTYEALNPSTGVRYGPMISNNVWFGRIG